MWHIDKSILKAVGTRFVQGDSFRIRHEYLTNGTVCTPMDKDPAMVVTRVSNGWLFICHRCHKQGMVPDKAMPPGQTRARIEALKNVPVDEKTKEVDLPADIMYMNPDYGDKEVSHNKNDVPWGAYHHLWKYGIRGDTIPKYQISWSPMWNRLIFPIFEYRNFGQEVTYKLVGWVGRNVGYKKGDKYPKWLTRTKKNKRRFFMAPGNTDHVVLVEDVISAIKVHEATGYTTIALLTTTVSDDLMRWLRDKITYLWLDSDMLAHSVKTVNRMRDLGLKAKHIYTTRDPKEYNSLHIIDCLRQKGETYDKVVSKTNNSLSSCGLQ
jgi:hypothetical protein